MTTKTLTDDTLQESLDLIYWTVVDAVEMNPDCAEEINAAWQLIMDNLNDPR